MSVHDLGKNPSKTFHNNPFKTFDKAFDEKQINISICCSACWYHVIACCDWRIGVLHWCYVCMCSNWGTHGRRHVLLTKVLFAVHLRSNNDVFALSYDETTGAFNMFALDIAMYLCLHARLTLKRCSSYSKSTTLIILWMTACATRNEPHTHTARHQPHTHHGHKV